MHFHLHRCALFINARVSRIDFERLAEITNGVLKALFVRRGESALLIGDGEIRREFAVEIRRFTKRLDGFVPVLILGGLRTCSGELRCLFAAVRLSAERDRSFRRSRLARPGAEPLRKRPETMPADSKRTGS